MQKSETAPAAKQNLNRRASIAPPIAVNDDEEIGESVTAKAAAAWGGFMGKMKSYAAPVAGPPEEEDSDSEEEGKFDPPSGDAKLELPAAGDGPPRDSFAGADDVIEDDEGGATVPKLGALEVAGKHVTPEPIKVEVQESKKIEAADALELTPGTSYYGELL